MSRRRNRPHAERQAARAANGADLAEVGADDQQQQQQRQASLIEALLGDQSWDEARVELETEDDVIALMRVLVVVGDRPRMRRAARWARQNGYELGAMGEPVGHG